jgi:purine-binding chemotaxis protein CheW
MADEAKTAPAAGWREARKARILHERAVALARRHDRPEEAEILIDIVKFRLAEESYAIESVFVREVQPLRGLTPVPCTPPFILGIVNLRGQILTVLDLKRFFDLPERGISDLDKLIILRAGPMELGVLADAVLGVDSIPMSHLQVSLPTLSGIRADYLRGVTDDRIAVLDAEKILADNRIVVREEVEG